MTTKKEKNPEHQLLRYVKDGVSNIRHNLPESYPARIMAIIEDLDYPFDYYCTVRGEDIHLSLNANDFFDYATAAAVSILEEDMEMFEATARELEQLEIEGILGDKDYPTLYIDQLFMCRKRKRKPLEARLTREGYVPKELVPLFEACEESNG